MTGPGRSAPCRDTAAVPPGRARPPPSPRCTGAQAGGGLRGYGPLSAPALHKRFGCRASNSREPEELPAEKPPRGPPAGPPPPPPSRGRRGCPEQRPARPGPRRSLAPPGGGGGEAAGPGPDTAPPPPAAAPRVPAEGRRRREAARPRPGTERALTHRVCAAGPAPG